MPDTHTDAHWTISQCLVHQGKAKPHPGTSYSKEQLLYLRHWPWIFVICGLSHYSIPYQECVKRAKLGGWFAQLVRAWC
jgi:hypothetical protein